MTATSHRLDAAGYPTMSEAEWVAAGHELPPVEGNVRHLEPVGPEQVWTERARAHREVSLVAHARQVREERHQEQRAEYRRLIELTEDETALRIARGELGAGVAVSEARPGPVEATPHQPHQLGHQPHQPPAGEVDDPGGDLVVPDRFPDESVDAWALRLFAVNPGRPVGRERLANALDINSNQARKLLDRYRAENER
jgi:hypothetical protein